MSASFISQAVCISEILHDFHSAPISADGRTTPCPVCEQTLYIYPRHLLCENRACTFRAGGAVDLLAAIDGGYDKALQTINKAYPKRFVHMHESDLPKAAEQFRKQRRIFTFLIQHSQPPEEVGAIDLIQAHAWLRRNGMHSDIQPASLICLNKTELTELLEIAYEMTGKELPRSAMSSTGKITVIMPVFAAPSVIAGFFMFPAHNPDHTFLHHFELHRFAFTGLLDRHPRNEEVELRTDLLASLACNSHYSKLSPEKFSTTLIYEPRGGAIDWSFDSVLYFPTAKEDIGLMRGISDLAKTTTVRVHHDPYAARSWSEFAMDYAVAHVQENSICHSTESTLSALHFDDAEYEQLCRELNLLGLMSETLQLEKMRATRALFSEDGIDYHQSPDGYFILRTDGSRIELTNFLCHFDKNIAFPDANMYCYSGTMTFAGNQYALTISDHDLSTAATLEIAARMTEFKQSKPIESGTRLPTICERNHSRTLLNYLRRTTGKLNRSEGMGGLGWNRSKQGFWTPWGLITADSWDPNVRVPNPSLEFWHCYDLNIQPIPMELHTDVPLIIADIISRLVGFLGRSYADFSMKPLPISFTPDGQHILRNLFRSIGQVTPLSYVSRTTGSMEVKGLNGFPMLVTGATRGQLERAGQSFVAFGDTGAPIYGAVDDAALASAMRMMPWLIRDCLQWLMRTEGRALKMFNSVDYGTALAREGAAIITTATGLKWPVATPVYLCLERLLNQIPFTHSSKFLTQHLMDQTVIISVDGLHCDLSELYMELITTCRQVTQGETSITVDAISMLNLLHNFYGQIPTMQRTGVPTVTQLEKLI